MGKKTTNKEDLSCYPLLIFSSSVSTSFSFTSHFKKLQNVMAISH